MSAYIPTRCCESVSHRCPPATRCPLGDQSTQLLMAASYHPLHVSCEILFAFKCFLTIFQTRRKHFCNFHLCFLAKGQQSFRFVLESGALSSSIMMLILLESFDHLVPTVDRGHHVVSAAKVPDAFPLYRLIGGLSNVCVLFLVFHFRFFALVFEGCGRNPKTFSCEQCYPVRR
jgi:hypothetical protein